MTSPDYSPHRYTDRGVKAQHFCATSIQLCSPFTETDPLLLVNLSVTADDESHLMLLIRYFRIFHPSLTNAQRLTITQFCNSQRNTCPSLEFGAFSRSSDVHAVRNS